MFVGQMALSDPLILTPGIRCSLFPFHHSADLRSADCVDCGVRCLLTAVSRHLTLSARAHLLSSRTTILGRRGAKQKSAWNTDKKRKRYAAERVVRVSTLMAALTAA